MATFGERMEEQERRRSTIAAEAKSISNAISRMSTDERSRSENRAYGREDVGQFDSFGQAAHVARALIARIEAYDVLVTEYLAVDREEA
jgi:hypothetical protein